MKTNLPKTMKREFTTPHGVVEYEFKMISQSPKQTFTTIEIDSTQFRVFTVAILKNYILTI